jgi:hypothetical protein
MLLLALALAPGLALGQTLINLASLPVSFTCLAQEPDLRESLMAERRKRDHDTAEVAGWEAVLRDSSWAACVRKKKWVSKAYCTDLVEASERGTRRDVVRVMEEYRDEYRGLKPMVDFFQAHYPKGGAEAAAEVSCPE